jgi:tRNA threonylcarbamoyladenosine biosynthesis protein TsaB
VILAPVILAPVILAPVILAIDTTHEYGSIALAPGGAAMDEMPLYAPEGFAQVLYGYLDELLKRNGVKLGDVTCFAAASGPGSFTGVRIGLACIKGLAEVMGKPALGVSNLQAIASFGTAPLRAAVMDARRGDVYGAVYDAAGRLVLGETVSKLASWLETLPAGELEILSPDFEPESVVVKKTPREIAGAVARLAFDRLARGDAGDPVALDANYVRRADAELFWKDV